MHISLYVTNTHNVLVFFTVMRYEKEENNLTCTWTPRHAKRSKLFRNLLDNKDLRCVECVPWGNYKVSQCFKIVGKLIAEY